MKTRWITMVAIIMAISILMLSNPLLAAGKGNVYKAIPSGFKKVSSLVQLPDYLPGMGTLYVNPATLPYGPFLGYDRKGKLVNAISMVPIKDFDEHKAIENLGKDLPGLKVDHVDLAFNPGHPGVQEPHYHITLWLISHSEEARMK